MNIKDLIEKAKNKDENAMYVLGLLYLKGEKGIEKNIDKAYQLLEDSANLGRVDSLYQLAKIHLNNDYGKKDLEKAIKLLSQSSKKGHTNSSYELGLIYYKGIGTDVNYEQAEEYLRNASVNVSHPVEKAQLIMANIYENGLLLNHVDLMEAYRFYLLAANSGNSFAQYKVGSFLITGISDGLDKNIEEGISYLTKASESGEKKASIMLAKFFIEEAKNMLEPHAKDDREIEYILNPLSKINTDLL